MVRFRGAKRREPVPRSVGARGLEAPQSSGRRALRLRGRISEPRESPATLILSGEILELLSSLCQFAAVPDVCLSWWDVVSELRKLHIGEGQRGKGREGTVFLYSFL